MSVWIVRVQVKYRIICSTNELIPLFKNLFHCCVPNKKQRWLHNALLMLSALQSSSILWRFQYGRCHLEVNCITILRDSICSFQRQGDLIETNHQICDEITSPLYKDFKCFQQLVTVNILSQHTPVEELAISKPTSFNYIIAAYCEARVFLSMQKTH